jgi:hypothetical protein
MAVQRSFYIPRVAIRYNTELVAGVFERFYIGRIYRVDFIEIPGDANFQSAFVHMEIVYDVPTTDLIIYKVFVQNKPFKIQPELFGGGPKWTLLKNKNPITETRLNIHQIVENAKKLEVQVRKQEVQLSEQEERIYKLESIITAVAWTMMPVGKSQTTVS